MAAIDHKDQFKQRVRHWAGKLDVKIAWLGVRPMRSKWASCSTAGHLNFSDELPALKPELWDYVIVHELLHFSVPNHGRLWKSLMRAHLGDYEAHERALKRIATSSAPVSPLSPTASPAPLTPPP
ncbi:MAG: M48 family metallopeptidase [Rhodocyclaceae bacterium]|jgi:predicted metal-dependent hydrolase|nr:M48 family metallopeptidase [Rhodocyclaceae bacterium]